METPTPELGGGGASTGDVEGDVEGVDVWPGVESLPAGAPVTGSLSEAELPEGPGTVGSEPSGLALPPGGSEPLGELAFVSPGVEGASASPQPAAQHASSAHHRLLP